MKGGWKYNTFHEEWINLDKFSRITIVPDSTVYIKASYEDGSWYKLWHGEDMEEAKVWLGGFLR